ncbi:histidine phosphatase family protein [Zhongshania sp. BJYM1]|uniref:histidine phosphatase family protein n=1 Tax=Zhongshania aquatica TaxID=2965069 RepID=UPI0022B5D17D|nr:histidine phosphatase family protein [Marortus sp. BJYM1]
MAEVIVVRHGQAAFGTDDYDRLTGIGWEQARLLGAHFADIEQGFDAVFTGTMRRHRETLAGISEVLAQADIHLPDAVELPGLNEYDFHSLVASYVAAKEDVPEEPQPDLANAKNFYRVLRLALLAWSRGELLNVAEPWQRFEQRVRGTLAATSAIRGRVLVVTSGGPISAMLREVLKLDVETMVNTNLQAKNTGVTRYFTRGSQFNLNMFNAVPHLENVSHRHLITYT